MEVTERKTCRVCGSASMTPLFSLGTQFVSDFVAREDIHKGIKAPIDLEVCTDCTLVQLKHTAPQELLYKRHYWYHSSTTQTMRKALKEIATVATEIAGLKEGDIVLDIGANDGTLLRNYGPGIIRVGVEPANNLAAECREACDVFIHDFWSADAYLKTFERFPALLGYGRFPFAKVVSAIGCFYDLDDPSAFIGDIAKVLAPDGVFIAQLMCLKNMLNANDLGNLAHEHLLFFSLKSLDVLFGKHGLEIFDIQKVNINGESYRLFVRHIGKRRMYDSIGIDRLAIAYADEQGLMENDYGELRAFFARMEENKRQVRKFVVDAVMEGKTVWVYGASTKGNVILQFFDLDHTLIAGAADRSPEKWGKFTVGTGIPIFSEEYARKQEPDYFLCLPYAFREEMVEREAKWRSKGGRWIFPLPRFEVV
jgi:NDP-4-keto-2,6-dideoxyhexose 3-C-methyltransferase